MKNSEMPEHLFKRIRSNNLPKTFLVSGALQLALFPMCMGVFSFAYAQPKSVHLEEIVVTATRREEGLQSVPASISAVTAEDLQRQGVTGFKGLTDIVSGVTLNRPESAVSAGLYIRGVGTSGSTPASQSVGVLIDDVYQVRQGVAFTELMDIERVEVLRGPQGTLFGKNTTAGAIRITTADPELSEFSGRVQGVVGNLDSRELRGIVNIPIVEDVLAARVSAYDVDRDGYTKNVFLGIDTRNVDRQGFRAKVLFQPLDNLSVKLTAESMEQESDSDHSLVSYGPNYTDIADTLPPVELGRYQQNVNTFNTDDVERYSLSFSLDLFNHTLKTVHTKEESELFLNNDQDHTVLNGFPDNLGLSKVTNESVTKVTTHELQLHSNFDGAANYVLGYFFQNEDLESTTTLFRGSGGVIPRPPTVADVDSNAVFGTLFLDFDDRWGASLGARYTEDERQGSNSQVGSNHTVTFNEWTWSAKLTYQLDADKMLYFAYDKGFKSGGVNRGFGACGLIPGAPCLRPDQALWEPETTFNYEIGMKSEWLDNTLRLNVTLFHQIYEDFQVTENVLSEANVVVTNAAEVTSNGLEGEVLWAANDILTLNANFTLAETEYDKFENSPCASASQPGCVNGVIDLSGKRLNNAPEASINLGAELRDQFEPINGSEWFVRLDASYRSDQNLSISLPESTEQSGYGILNGRFGINVYDSWQLTIWGKNLLDKEYVDYAETGGTGIAKIPGLPRTYGLTVDWHL